MWGVLSLRGPNEINIAIIRLRYHPVLYDFLLIDRQVFPRLIVESGVQIVENIPQPGIESCFILEWQTCIPAKSAQGQHFIFLPLPNDLTQALYLLFSHACIKCTNSDLTLAPQAELLQGLQGSLGNTGEEQTIWG